MDDEDISDMPKIKVFYPTDESLKLLGELLTNDTSRNIILTLGIEEMYINKLAEKLDMRVSLVIHHLKKLEDLGLLDIVEKPISKRTKDHKFFKLRTDVFLSFTEDKKENKLKKIFKEGIKFASIGITALSSYLFTSKEKILGRVDQDFSTDVPIIQEYFIEIPLAIVIVGLIILLIIEKRKKR